VLASVCPRTLIEEVLVDTGRANQRERLLPAPAVVYYVMALALWREAPLEEVLRVVCEGLQWLGGEGGAVQASKSAISQARTRLEPECLPAGPRAGAGGMRHACGDGCCGGTLQPQRADQAAELLPPRLTAATSMASTLADRLRQQSQGGLASQSQSEAANRANAAPMAHT
jgi:hypothetical protein